MATLERAIEIAARAYAGQIDKAGEPYILHPLWVMFRMETPEERMTAVLHDIVEDTDWTFERLQAEGFPDEVIEALRYLTKQRIEKDDENTTDTVREMNYSRFIVRAGGNPIAKRVKLADLEDNMDLSRLKEVTDRDRQRSEKYRRAATLLELVVTDTLPTSAPDNLDELIMDSRSIPEFINWMHYPGAINSQAVLRKFESNCFHIYWMYYIALFLDSGTHLELTLDRDCSDRRRQRLEYIDRHFATNEPHIEASNVLRWQYKEMLAFTDTLSPLSAELLRSRLDFHFRSKGSLKS